MAAFKSGIILMVVFIEQSTQFSISSELNSELPSTSSSASPSNRTGCFKTIGQCFKLKPPEMAACALERAMSSMNCLITTNRTWHVNQFITLKKNDDWAPTEIEARQDQTLFQSVLSKLSDLIASKSVQFSMPLSELAQSWDARVKSGFDFSALNIGDIGGGLGAHGESGKKKSDHWNFITFVKHILDLWWNRWAQPEKYPIVFLSGRKKKMKGGFNGTWAIIAMMAQLFVGKIAFLAGAALLLSKVSLLFSIVVWRIFILLCPFTQYFEWKSLKCSFFYFFPTTFRTHWKSITHHMAEKGAIMSFMLTKDTVAITNEVLSNHQWNGHSLNYLRAHCHRIHRKYKKIAYKLQTKLLEILKLFKVRESIVFRHK